MAAPKFDMKKALGPTKPVNLGTWRLSDNTLRYGDLNRLYLGQLPVSNDGGIAMLVALDIEESDTYSTVASDPAVPSYMLDDMSDLRLVSSDNAEWINWLGWHRPIRAYDRYRTLKQFKIDDLPATGGGGAGSYTRTRHTRIDFLDSRWSETPWLKLLPCAYFRQSGRVELNVKQGPIYLNGATVGTTAKEVTVTAYVADWRLSQFPIPVYARETFEAGDSDAKPSPKQGTYEFWAVAKRPGGADAGDSTPPNDDLVDIEKIRVGVPNKPLYDRYTHDAIKRYMLGSPDDHLGFSATGLAFQEIHRFPDYEHNTSGQLHYIPLLVPKQRGQKLSDVYDFGGANPQLEMNDNNSKPYATVDHIVTRWEDRSDAMVRAILGSLNLAGKFSGDQRKHVISEASNPIRQPLLIQL